MFIMRMALSHCLLFIRIMIAGQLSALETPGHPAYLITSIITASHPESSVFERISVSVRMRELFFF